MEGNMCLQSWVDSSDAMNRDMKGHTGGIVSLGKGTAVHGCAKQKINTKSSTETELVVSSNFLPTTIWTKYFLEAQGYKVNRSVFYQDNTIVVLK